MTFVQARNYTRGRTAKVRLIVVHTMESAEQAGTARSVAAWFASPAAPQASAHYCVDAAEVVQCVRDDDTAWHAPGANHDGIGVEHAGCAAQTAAQWDDAYSRSVLATSARLTAALCHAHRIPVRHLSDEQLAAGAAGFIGHVQASRVYRRSDHTDPGEHFPWAAYIALVERELARLQAPVKVVRRPVATVGRGGVVAAVVGVALAVTAHPAASTTTSPRPAVTVTARASSTPRPVPSSTPTVRPAVVLRRVLQAGEHGADVAAVQARLRIPVTRVFDARTVATVRAAQSHRRLRVDGRVGRPLAVALGFRWAG